MITLPDGLRLVLGSASPRRRELLHSVGLEFDVLPADIDESVRPGETPGEYVARLSLEKAAKIAISATDAVVVAADTTVDVAGQILEKPVDDADAWRMLQLLSGRTHLVHTGVTVWKPSSTELSVIETQVIETQVTFIELTDSVIGWYIATGEPDGKAGAYGIQGAAAAFVERVEGSVTNVIGLPLAETLAMIRRALSTG